jgi:hypothetical protein
MALHFERSEYQARIAATIEALGDNGLDGLLMFHQRHPPFQLFRNNTPY